VRIAAQNTYFFGQWERNAISQATKFPNLGGLARFLSTEIIAREADYDDAFAMRFVQFLELCILWCVAACAGYVDDQNLFSGKPGKINFPSLNAFHLKLVNGIHNTPLLF
jgi:hypothetical protein